MAPPPAASCHFAARPPVSWSYVAAEDRLRTASRDHEAKLGPGPGGGVSFAHAGAVITHAGLAWYWAVPIAATIDALVAYVSRLVPGGPPIPSVDPAAGDLADGGQLFRAQCAACHQWAGEGGALLHREAPSLGPATPTQLAEAVRTGPGAMPTFGATAAWRACLIPS